MGNGPGKLLLKASIITRRSNLETPPRKWPKELFLLISTLLRLVKIEDFQRKLFKGRIVAEVEINQLSKDTKLLPRNYSAKVQAKLLESSTSSGFRTKTLESLHWNLEQRRKRRLLEKPPIAGKDGWSHDARGTGWPWVHVAWIGGTGWPCMHEIRG